MGNKFLRMMNQVGFDYTKLLFYNYNNGLFKVLYRAKKPLESNEIIEIFRLINESFSDSKFISDSYCCALGEISIIEYADHYYVHRQNMLNDIIVKFSLNIQGIDKEIYKIPSTNLGLEFQIYDFDRNSDLCNIDDDVLYSIKIYPFAYFDQIEIEGKVYDQKIAAKLNRALLKDFLIGFEEIVGSKPIDIFPYSLEAILYEYGVNDKAKNFKF